MTAAMREVRAQYAHPYFWAPFVLVGERRRFERYISGSGEDPSIEGVVRPDCLLTRHHEGANETSRHGTTGSTTCAGLTSVYRIAGRRWRPTSARAAGCLPRHGQSPRGARPAQWPKTRRSSRRRTFCAAPAPCSRSSARSACARCRAPFLARLVQNDLLDPVPAGIRGNEAASRQLLFQASGIYIDLRLEQRRGQACVALVGQLLGRESLGEPIARRPIVLTSGREVVSMVGSNETASFTSNHVPAGQMRLHIPVEAGARRIEIESQCVDAAQRGGARQRPQRNRRTSAVRPGPIGTGRRQSARDGVERAGSAAAHRAPNTHLTPGQPWRWMRRRS